MTIVQAMVENQTAAINIIELFRSVQGETSFTGLPTSFIRLAACNLRCSWCDTAYSFGRGTPYSLERILDTVESYGCRHVCVTGGEPLLQDNVLPLMSQLCDRQYKVSLETGGSLSTSQVDPRVKIILDVKCPGSGMEEKNHWPNLACLRSHDEVKFVIADRKDYEYSKEIVARHRLDNHFTEVLFSPVFGQLDSRELVNWILEDCLSVRLNLQVHKFIWSPDTRGV